MFLVMEVKVSQMALWDVVYSPPWEQQKSWASLDFKVGHKCNELNWKLKDGGGPT
jgi:hypothetical protein